jgi:hypothetical protein
MQIIALEPPGNVARDLALFRRKLFSVLGEGSALAFPEIVPLAFSSRPRGSEPMDLSDCWQGLEGGFSSSGLLLSGGKLYLSLSGPLDTLSSRASALLLPGEAEEAMPLEAGLGVFLCRPRDPVAAMEEAERIGAPRADFLDCSLVLLALRYSADPFSALRWREQARAKRRTGAPERAS